jgi:hypothetical protein
MKHFSRFEIRDCRTGWLQEAHATIETALTMIPVYAQEDGMTCCIVDTYLPAFGADGTPDVRTVYGSADLSEEGRKWIVNRNRNEARLRQFNGVPVPR